MSDYKEILRQKATKLRDLLDQYGDELQDSEKNEIQNLIDNAFEITNGRLDKLDYDIRDKGIMYYHNLLDEEMRKFNKFKSIEKEEEI